VNSVISSAALIMGYLKYTLSQGFREFRAALECNDPAQMKSTKIKSSCRWVIRKWSIGRQSIQRYETFRDSIVDFDYPHHWELDDLTTSLSSNGVQAGGNQSYTEACWSLR
jgi:hypothetical protein